MQTRREQDFVCVEVSETGENTLVGEDFDEWRCARTHHGRKSVPTDLVFNRVNAHVGQFIDGLAQR